MKLFKFLVANFLLLCINNNNVTAQNLHTSLSFEEYTLIRDIGDLPDNNLLNLLKDNLGFLWMNTQHHLVRFDGNTFLIIESQPRSQFRLNGNNLKNIGTDPGGNIIVQYDDAAALFDIIDPISLEITPIFIDQSKIVDAWVGDDVPPTILTTKNDSLFINEIENGSINPIPKVIVGNFWNNLTEVRIGFRDQEAIWLYENRNAIYKVTEHGFTTYNLNQNYNDGGIAFMHKSKSGLLLGFNDAPGIFHINFDKDTIELSRSFPQTEVYGNIWEDKSGNLLLSIKENFRIIKEYILLDNQQVLHRNLPLTDQSLYVSDLYAEDIFKKPYFTTGRGLFVGENRNALFEYSLNQDVPENQFGTVLRGITMIDSNLVVVSHEFDSISTIDLRTNKTFSNNIVLTNPEDSVKFQMSCASNLNFDGDSLIWGSSCDAQKNAYLYSFNTKTDSVSTYLCFKNSLITDLSYDKIRQNIWLTLRYQGKDGILGIFNLIDSTFRIEKGPIDPIFKGNIPNAIFADTDDLLFIATDKGLVQYDINSGELSLEVDELKEQKLYCVLRSSDGSLIAGGYNGLFIVDNESNVTSYSREQGIKSRIASILEDNFNNLWIGTYNGLLYFDRSLGIVTQYNVQDGLPSDEFNTRSFYSGISNYYFGTINGLVKVKSIKDNVEDELKPSILQIRKLNSTKGSIIQRSNLSGLKKLIINPSDLTVNISIFNPYFLTQKKESFAYKIEGSDLEWTPIALNEDIQLERLAPGDYTLRLRMKKDNGLWSTGELTLPITVRDEFYKSGSFILLSLISVLGIFGLIMYYYNVRSRKKQAEDNEIKQKFAELELHALRAQMNPHFIFNSLNAIQYFIQSNDRKQSDEYISKFAHLIRLFLDASTKKYISLAEEIKVIRAYIDLEQLRFRGKLYSQFEIEESLNSLDTEIPSMLIQPFVENAINHGIFHKEGKGTVKISIKAIGEDMIECAIEDDGIGRKKAMDIKMNSIGKYESRGISIIDERIQVLQRSLDQDIDYKIVDKEENGIPKGTKVILKLPILN